MTLKYNRACNTHKSITNKVTIICKLQAFIFKFTMKHFDHLLHLIYKRHNENCYFQEIDAILKDKTTLYLSISFPEEKMWDMYNEAGTLFELYKICLETGVVENVMEMPEFLVCSIKIKTINTLRSLACQSGLI